MFVGYVWRIFIRVGASRNLVCIPRSWTDTCMQAMRAIDSAPLSRSSRSLGQSDAPTRNAFLS